MLLADAALDGSRRWVTLVAIAGTGVMAGFFLAFSTIAMTGIRAIPGEQGLRAMQSINRAANSSAALIVTLLGTGLACVVLGASAVGRLDQRVSTLHLAAGALYVAGVLAVTFVYHVPRNEALGLVDPNGPDSVAAWVDYAAPWVAWNHVRTAAALASSVLLTLSLRAS